MTKTRRNLKQNKKNACMGNLVGSEIVASIIIQFLTFNSGLSILEKEKKAREGLKRKKDGQKEVSDT